VVYSLPYSTDNAPGRITAVSTTGSRLNSRT
jgi:hypothetical protein